MQLQQTVQHFSYPATPEIANSVSQQLRQRSMPLPTWARGAAVFLALCLALLAVPQIRAAVQEILQIGAVRIFPAAEPTQTVTPIGLPSLLDLADTTTLAEAAIVFPAPISLPTYPSEAGLPQRIFLNNRRTALTLIWLNTTDTIWFSLTIANSKSAFDKYYPWNQQETSVNGGFAVWLTNPHTLYEGQVGIHDPLPTRRIVQQQVLIWEDTTLGITYRLENDFILSEALQVAESLVRWGE